MAGLSPCFQQQNDYLTGAVIHAVREITPLPAARALLQFQLEQVPARRRAQGVQRQGCGGCSPSSVPVFLAGDPEAEPGHLWDEWWIKGCLVPPGPVRSCWPCDGQQVQASSKASRDAIISSKQPNQARGIWAETSSCLFLRVPNEAVAWGLCSRSSSCLKKGAEISEPGY